MSDLGVNKVNSWQEAQKHKPPESPEFSSEEIIVKFRQEADFDPDKLQTRSPRLNDTLKKHGVRSAEKLHNGKPKIKNEKAEKVGIDRIYRLKVPKGSDIQKIIDELRANPEVEYAEPNYKIKATAIPNDSSFPLQWGLAKINAPAAWDINTGSNSVIIAVVDTGIDRTHPDLAANIWTNPGEIPGNGIDDDGNGKIDDVYGWNFVGGNNNTLDDNSHGTHVAGIIGAVGNNSLGIAGVNWQVKIMPVKCMNSNGVGSMWGGAQSIIYAADNGAKIINASWGGYFYDVNLENAVNYAYSLGSLVIAAAGNDNTEAPMYPASYPGVVSVGATDASDQKTSFSNYGNYIDLVAPGQDIYSTLPAGSFGYMSGTSMAAPLVAGLAGLIKAKNPTYTNEEVYQNLIESTLDLGSSGWDNIFGYGRIDAQAALTGIRPLTSSISSPSEGEVVNGIFSINGSSYGTNFDHFVIEWGEGDSPVSWSSAGVSLTNGGTVPVMSGVLGSLDVSVLPSEGPFTLKLRSINSSGKNYENKILLFKNSTSKPGWPVMAQGYFSGCPIIADINGDGYKEIIIPCSDGKIRAFDRNGQEITNNGWPYVLSGGPLLANYKDRILSVGGNSMYLFNFKGQNLPGWPISISGESYDESSPVFYDVNNDGKPEIISTHYASQNSLSLYNENGQNMPGWPKIVATFPNFGYFSFPAIGDVNGDGNLEIAVPGNGNSGPYFYGGVFLFDLAGNILPGWPVAVSGVPGPVSALTGDINGDGKDEVIVAAGDPTSSGTLSVLNASGANIPGFPISISPFASCDVPAIGDIDGDNQPEIVIAGSTRVCAYKNNGNILPGWPKIMGTDWSTYSPILADVDGDGLPDVVSIDFGGCVHAWKFDGTEIDGWPKYLGWSANVGTWNPPVAADIDNDGLTEIIVSNGKSLFVFDTPAVFAKKTAPWPTFKQNDQRTGHFPGIVSNPMVSGEVNDGLATDIDFQSSTSSLSANWRGFLDLTPGASAIKEFKYCIGTTPFGTDFLGWTSAGLNNNFTKTGLTLPHGTKFYTTVRAINYVNQYADACSDGVLIDTTPPTGTVNDGTGADINYQSSATDLSANWSITDPESGIAGYSYSIGTSAGGTDVLGWTDAGMSTSFTKNGLSLINGQIYYVNVRALNGAGASSIITSDGVMFDVPYGTVNDGTGADINYQSSATDLSANWSITDPKSSIAGYSYSIGTSAGGTDVLGWTDVGLATSFNKTGLSLVNGKTYYTNVRALNQVEMASIISSNGVKILSSPLAAPSYVNDGTGADIDWQLGLTSLSANWAAVPDAFKYWYAIGTTSGGTDAADWADNSTATSMNRNLSLINGQKYYVSVRAENILGMLGAIKISNGVLAGIQKFAAYSYPNPFSLSKGALKIHYEMPTDGRITIQIFDTDGYLFKDLIRDERKSGGAHDVEWDGSGSIGQKVPEKVYFCVVQVKNNEGEQTEKKVIKILVTQ